MISGPIVIVDDDEDDINLLKDIMEEMGVTNALLPFHDCDQAFGYLLTTSDQPFIIICDVNMPGKNGVEFKKEIDDNHHLRKKSIPFVFYTTYVDKNTVDYVYENLTTQGFFQKGKSYEEIKQTLQLILNYWKVCRHPNS